MARFANTINLEEERNAFDNGKSTIQEFAQKIANKVKALNIKDDHDYNNVIMEFERLADDDDVDDSDFDYELEGLYDWADTENDDRQRNCKIEM